MTIPMISPGSPRATSATLTRLDALLLNSITRNPSAALLHASAVDQNCVTPISFQEDLGCRLIVEGAICWRDPNVPRRYSRWRPL